MCTSILVTNDRCGDPSLRSSSSTTWQALSVSDLNMVLFVCERVDAQRLFSQTPCVLPQPVLLSLIQQLSADLGTATELKLE